MHTLSTTAIVGLLALGAPALAQTPNTQTNPQSETQSQVTIRSVQVVDVKELSPESQTKVEAIIASTTGNDLQSLRKTIDASPKISSALKAKGLNSKQVVAINIDNNGVLTMFTQKDA